METNGLSEDRQPVTGRAKTIIVNNDGLGRPVGVVSEVVVTQSYAESEDRLAFKGPVHLKERGKHHLKSVVLPLVDKITENLGLPERHYAVSIVNIGAAASSGIGVEITGFSAELPLFLALLSSAIEVALRQDLVSTGHIASLEGDIATVRDIPAKIDAALTSQGITGIIMPDLDRDISLKVLTPIEYQAAKDSLLAHRGELKIYQVKDIFDAVKRFMSAESIMSGSLKAGFFDGNEEDYVPVNTSDRISALLANGNAGRFWNTLEHDLLNRYFEKAKALLKTYAGFFIQKGRYPENFGESLYRLVLSLPPSLKRLNDLFPLLPTDLCIRLSQHAEKGVDQEDVRRLYKAAFGEDLVISPDITSLSSEQPAGEEEMLKWILSEISEETLAEKIGHALDSARLSYVTDKVTVKDAFGFNDSITAFYAHLFRHTNSPAGPMQKDGVFSKASTLVEKAFSHKGGYQAALSEGIFGVHGGLRLVFDAMTEQLKRDEQEEYINAVFKKAMDALGWETIVRLMRAFTKRIGVDLPADVQDMPPERLARQWEAIIRLYVQSRSPVKALLKRL